MMRAIYIRFTAFTPHRADDLERIADAEACMAVAEEVTLAEYTQAEKIN